MSSFTLEDAVEIIGKVIDNNGRQPLRGKETLLQQALIEAEQQHDLALEKEPFNKHLYDEADRLQKSLRKTLSVLKESEHINLALFDPDLDLSYFDPGSKNDLKGLIERAIKALG